MEIIRRYVLPLFWLGVAALIAVALAKMAFFPSSGPSQAELDNTAAPVADVEQYATTTVTRGDIASELDLTATITPDEGTPLKARVTGDINKIWAGNGTPVSKGDRILQVRVEETPPADPAEQDAPAEASDGGTGADDATGATPEPADPAPRYRYINLYAPADGTVRGLTVEEWDSISTGDALGMVSPGTYSAVAPLTPPQQLSLLDVTLRATLTLPGTDQPMQCTDPRIVEDDEVPAAQAPQSAAADDGSLPTDGSVPADDGGQGSGVSAARIICPLPQDAKVVPALEAPMTVSLGSSTDVLLVPATAVVGEGTRGQVFVIGQDGEPSAVDVTLGKRDGDMVEVSGGVTEDQQVLQFAPGVDAVDDGTGEGDTW